MHSLTERIRFSFEEAEFYESLFVEETAKKTCNYTESLKQQHFASYLLEQITQLSSSISSIFDRDEIDKEKQRLLVGSNLDQFYKDLSGIVNDHHLEKQTVDEFDIKRKMWGKYKESFTVEGMFSGEEGNGKFLDLNGFLLKYNNLKGVTEPTGLIEYLEKFADFSNVKKETKHTHNYKVYLNDLREYLEEFIRRATPLFNLTAVKKELNERFNSEWNEHKSENNTGIWCERCAKYFAKQTVFDSHLTGKKHQKSTTITPENQTSRNESNASENQSSRNEGNASENQSSRNECNTYENGTTIERGLKQAALDEFLIKNYAEILKEKIADTISNIERKKVQTLREREESDGEIEIDETRTAANEQLEGKIYNPLKLPLDWDGKPIPYWLWKLHGLGTEFPCEICGGFVYMGRKAFDRHFQEWRHAYGMKCLGLVNSKYFYGITSIKDAFALSDKLKHQTRVQSFTAESMEEYEDENGNVFSRKTFEDMRKQGLI